MDSALYSVFENSEVHTMMPRQRGWGMKGRKGLVLPRNVGLCQLGVELIQP